MAGNAKHGGSARPMIQSLGRGLQLLSYVASAEQPVPLGELAELLSVERSSAHRLMATLIAHGYVVQDSLKHYLPGPAIMALASKVGRRFQVQAVARPFLLALTEKTGETAHLATMGRHKVVLTDCVSSDHTLAVISRVGQAEPLYCTALGKALICEVSREELAVTLGAERLKKHTPRTITSMRGLLGELEDVRRHSLAEDDEEFRVGIRCLASPVRDLGGHIVAAIGVSGPVTRLDDRAFAKMGGVVCETASELSRQLGYVSGEDGA